MFCAVGSGFVVALTATLSGTGLGSCAANDAADAAIPEPLTNAVVTGAVVGVDPPDKVIVAVRAAVCGGVGPPGVDRDVSWVALPFAASMVAGCATIRAPAPLGVLDPTFIGVCPGPLVFVASTFVGKDHLLDVVRIGHSQFLVCQQPIRV